MAEEGEDLSEAGKRLLSSFALIEGKIKNETDKLVNAKGNTPAIKWLDEIRDKILNLKAISIVLDNQDDAYLIFETINTRGRDLSVADLAKNHFLMLLDQKNPALDSAKSAWGDMVELLQEGRRSVNIKTFLHHYWLSKYPYATEMSLFRDIRKKVNKTNVKKLYSEIQKDAQFYRTIVEPEFGNFWNANNSDLKQSLSTITGTLNISIANPLLLTVLRLYRSSQLKEGQARDLIQTIEKYHYIYTSICMLPSTGGISQMYALHARQINNAKTPNERGDEILEFKNKIKKKIPSKEEFISKFKKLVYTNTLTRQRELVKYTLWKLDRQIFHSFDYAPSTMTLEHIRPQSAPGNKRVIGQVGNLLLINREVNNTKLNNKGFKEKIAILKEGGRPLDKILSGKKDWSADEITERTKYLAELAYDSCWKIK